MFLRIINTSSMAIIGGASILLMFRGKAGLPFLVVSAAIIICVGLYIAWKGTYEEKKENHAFYFSKINTAKEAS